MWKYLARMVWLIPTGPAPILSLSHKSFLFIQRGTRPCRRSASSWKLFGYPVLCPDIYLSWDKKHKDSNCKLDIRPTWSTAAHRSHSLLGSGVELLQLLSCLHFLGKAEQPAAVHTIFFHTELSSHWGCTRVFCIQLALKQTDYHLGLYW